MLNSIETKHKTEFYSNRTTADCIQSQKNNSRLNSKTMEHKQT
jgi:hypothetical protein